MLESKAVCSISVGIFHALPPEKVDTGGGVALLCKFLVTIDEGRNGARADALAKKTIYLDTKYNLDGNVGKPNANGTCSGGTCR